jgi:septal ring factor EnvC (AmiA/AmiB activator)
MNLQNMKDWLTFAVSVVICVSGVIFWAQSANDPKFDRLENDIASLRNDINKIRDDNQQILRVIGRLEGKLDN